ncbi:MAG: Fic family protein [Propionicimonas sp.]|uniref:Fic family protein n=1 Tax=Propionicimonas sp. TaxID=1955623 RepID=UPI003D0A7A39
MSQLFEAPQLAADDVVVIEEIHSIRDQLASVLRPPKRWTGGLRRTSQARAIQGSNSIEGYTITEQDAAAAVEDEPPLSADERTWAEIVAYRRVLTYVVSFGAEPGFEIDESSIRSMHFMLLEHELSKSPGRYRTGSIYVQDEANRRTMYEGPEPAVVPDLMRELAASLSSRDGEAMVRAAMAHLNLVMIHPFRDGNGRMARALQTMVLAQDQVLEPTFSSIEEWLGHNTQHYYNVLAATGGGAWHPDRSTRLWVKFNLRAHHMQAQTLRRRVAEAESQWTLIDSLISQHGLPDRAGDAIFDALLGLRITRPSYVKRSEVEDRTATRDLARLVELGLLEPHGQTRARYYTAGALLREQMQKLRDQRVALKDPYPGLISEITADAAQPGFW